MLVLNNRFAILQHALLATIRSIGLLSIFIAVEACSAEKGEPEGTSSREAREQAVRSIPLSSLTGEAIKKLRPVIDDPTIFRRMPVHTIPADPEFFNFIVRYPEVLVEIWQEMGVTQVETDRTGQFYFKGDDGSGTHCGNELILGSDRLHIYYSEGYYDGGMVAKKLDGRCVCVVYGQGSVSDANQSTITGRMDVFLKLDNLGAELIAKTISPLVVKTADYNYIETLRFISQLSMAAQRDPEAVSRLSEKLDLLPDVKNRFIQVSNQAALRRDQLIATHWKQQFEKQKNAPVIIGSPSTKSDNVNQR
jgi:hypothetical protein